MKAGYVAVVGSTNAGKSTLVNTVLGEKVAIVSPKAQTTRENILGVLHEEDCQIVFIDTPGLHKASTTLGAYMTKCVDVATNSVDIILFVKDCQKQITERDQKLIESYLALKVPVIVALSKIDLVKKESLLLSLEKLNAIKDISAVVPISSHKNSNVEELITELKRYLPEGDRIFSEDVLTDKSVKYMVGEIIREKVLYRYNAEIPHGVKVSLNKFNFNEAKNLYEIDADIVCERKGHKAIIIGKQGEALKTVAKNARIELEKFLECKVFLTLWARVKEDWRNNPSLLNEYGYSESDLS